MRRHRKRVPGARENRYNYDAVAAMGRPVVPCRMCRRPLVVALLTGETLDSAIRYCDSCVGARARRLARGAEPADAGAGFCAAVDRVAVELGVAPTRSVLRRYPEVGRRKT